MNRPTISIGVPVYNGAQFVGKAIESLLNQTFADFELLVSDNASNDGTRQIVERYARSDSRIRVKGFGENIGAARNFNSVVNEAEGRFFKWAAHDDLHEPDFLQTCWEALQSSGETVLAYTDAVDIDSDENIIGPIYDSQVDLQGDSEDPVKRFHGMVVPNHSCIAVSGLVRTEILRGTRLIGPYTGSDRVLLAELALRGKLVKVRAPLFLHRQHAERSTRQYNNLQERVVWFDTSQEGRNSYPHWRRVIELWDVISKAQLTASQKLACLVEIARWIRRQGGREMKDDVVHSLLSRSRRKIA